MLTKAFMSIHRRQEAHGVVKRFPALPILAKCLPWIEYHRMVCYEPPTVTSQSITNSVEDGILNFRVV